MLSVINSTQESWNQFNFSKFQEELESVASSIPGVQEQSRCSRKNLVKLIVGFRNSAPQELRNAAAPLLKGFQTEVDDLTARSQKIEDTIVKIYRRVAVLPDPSLALTEAQSISDRVKKSTELQLENMKLRDMLKETQTELESCRSSEFQLKKAQSRIAEMEETAKRDLQESVAAHLAKLQEDFDKRQTEMSALISEANERLSTSEARTRTLSEALQSAQSQLFDFQTRFDELQMAKSKEVELLLGDLEKANERIALLETPKNKVAIVGEGESTERSHGTVDFELASTIEDLTSKLEQKKSEVDSLSQALHAAEERHQQTVGELQARLTASATALEAAETKVTTLTNELDRRHDYDDLCREITVLRSIEFPEGSEKLGMEEGQGAAEVSLEVRLRRKNEQLKNTIASISAEREQLEEEVVALRKDNSELRDRDQRQASLIRQLEESVAQMSSTEASASVPYHRTSILNSDSGTSAEQEMLGMQQLLLGSQPEAETASSGQFPGPASHLSMLAIVQSQRDRFRDRSRELEENLLVLRQQVLAVQTELDSVRQDNVRLYEKIKFMQSYSPSPPSLRSQASLTERQPASAAVTTVSILTPSPAPPPPGVPEADYRLLERYSHAYEARLNPFRQFGEEERRRRYQALQLHEKLIHSLGRLIIEHPGARLAAFLYAMALHLLVFVVLYKLAHTDAHRHMT
uniref:Protein CASP n=1 Tax=Schistocephalus solidus TaxID=70667 RepID=A0A0X3PU48_SCHSO